MPRTPEAPLYGLVLVGGESSRMGRDKAFIQYHNEPEWQRVFTILEGHTDKTFISLSEKQAELAQFADVPKIIDHWSGIGPINGIASALEEHPCAAWLVVACDMPDLTNSTVERMGNARNGGRVATVYVNEQNRIEPLCAIYESSIREHLGSAIARSEYGLRRCLDRLTVERVSLEDIESLANLNTQEEADAYRNESMD